MRQETRFDSGLAAERLSKRREEIAHRLKLVPLTLKQANQLVGQWHRHHKLAVGHRWSIGVEVEGELVGAVMVGRPVARMTPQYSVAEANRLVTNGHPNACSKLYAAAARAAHAMGFEEIQTFILETEPGTSLQAAGWTKDEDYSSGGDWNRPSRGGRRIDQPQCKKQRWFKRFYREGTQCHE